MSNSIPPFPADIDRNAFGHWFSGLTDGEGCFYAKTVGIHSPEVGYVLALRADDRPAIELIQSFFQCGTVRLYDNARRGNRKPTAKFLVARAKHLRDIIVPHFERFPLRAKKSRDFVVWKEIVALFCDVVSRPWRSRGSRDGFFSKWSASELERYSELVLLLKSQRSYTCDSSAVRPSGQAILPEPTLFDGDLT